MEFIKRLICHIPDKYFVSVRYYNIISNRNKSKFLPRYNELLKKEKIANDNKLSEKEKKKQEIKMRKMEKLKNKEITFRSLFISAYKKDPFLCPNCNIVLILSYSYYVNRKTFTEKYKEKLYQKNEEIYQ
jgi:hypothetical protein